MQRDEDFIRRLLVLRRKSGLSQSDFDKKMGLPKGSSAQYECGQRKPGLDNIKTMCKNLGCSFEELFGC